MKNRFGYVGVVISLLAACMLLGCAEPQTERQEISTQSETELESEMEPEHEAEPESETEPESEAELESEAEMESQAESESEAETESQAEPESEAETESEQQGEPETEVQQVTETQARGQNGYIVAIDAGHQAKGNNDPEPIGPGAAETKAKVAGGTTGTTTGLKEYELTLEVSLKLQAELESRGYQVVMVRTANEVDISNAERAEIANEAGANAFLRIHADGSDNASASGAMTICQTANNPYNGSLYSASRALSDDVLAELSTATGCATRDVWETDSMSGINWCQVPATIVELGFMTNPTEDALMASDDYQDKMVQGLANGLDKYFGL